MEIFMNIICLSQPYFNKDYETFKNWTSRKACIIDQYSKYEVKSIGKYVS